MGLPPGPDSITLPLAGPPVNELVARLQAAAGHPVKLELVIDSPLYGEMPLPFEITSFELIGEGVPKMYGVELDETRFKVIIVYNPQTLLYDFDYDMRK